MGKPEAEEIVSRLSNFVNNYGCDGEGFAEAVLQEHRTLQQSIFRLFLRTCKKWSELGEPYYDLRNEHTVGASKEIMNLFEGSDAVPFI